jgi:uncharacterized membrane protein
MTGGPTGKPHRLPEIDRLRGLVMVLMALDHMRDFLDADALRFNPTDLAHTYPALFFTRLVTHFCAPTFALLAGVGAFLYGVRIHNPQALSRFLLSRGLWLIALDAIFVSPVFTGAPGRLGLGALWAIGCGLVALAALSRLRADRVLTIGLAIVFGHDLLDGVHAADLGDFGPWWRLLHERGPLPAGLQGSVVYPILPWIGVLALGYGAGPLFQRPKPVRTGLLRVAGGGALLLFVLLRATNLYGDPAPWSPQSDFLFTVMSFLNVSKYPPSLLYLLLTLGTGALVIAPLARLDGKIGDALAVFGRTPLFFYILHLYVGGAAALIAAALRGYDLAQIGNFMRDGSPPADFGFGLAGAYVGWALLVIALYPLCRWFDGFKQRHASWRILSYL